MIRKLFVFFILILFSMGCATYGYYYSKPEEDKSYKFYPNGIVLFKLEGIDLFLHPKNETNFESGGIMPPVPIVIGKDSPERTHYSDETFEIEILLHSREDGLCFNPMEVYLVLENGGILRPSKYLIREGVAYWPLAKAPHNLLDYRSDHPSWKKEYIEGSESKYYGLVEDKNMRGIGFVVSYATGTPKPGTPFSIEMKGLRRFGQEVFISRIHYKDKSRYDWTFSY